MSEERRPTRRPQKINDEPTEEEKLEERVKFKRRDREAERIVKNEGWKPPDPGRSLAESRNDPPPPVNQVINGLSPEGIGIMSAQFKAGKTTLGIDMSACLASGDKFLGYFDVAKLDGNVGFWNLEVDESQMFAWQDRRFKSDDDKIHTAHLRGRRIDLLHEATAEWAINWLCDREIDAWIIDPLGRMLEQENDPSEFNRWFRALEGIVSEAGVRMTLIMHHSGHAGMGQADSVPRSRGASSMLGNTDVNISYRHGGDLGGYPPDSKRYLSAYGRGVDLWPEITLDFESATGRLYAVENAPGRDADKQDRLADKAVDAVTAAGDWVLNYTGLQDAIGGDKSNRVKAIAAAVKDGKLIKKPDGRSMLYALPGASTASAAPTKQKIGGGKTSAKKD